MGNGISAIGSGKWKEGEVAGWMDGWMDGIDVNVMGRRAL